MTEGTLTPELSKPRLRPYVSDNAVVAWIDILNASSMSNEKLVGVSLYLGTIASIMSGAPDLPDYDPSKTVNALMIGDAICIAQNSDAVRSREAVASAAIQLSNALFHMKLPHRGVIRRGYVQSGPAYSTLSGCEFITGRGVLNAYAEEQKLKVTGIKISSNLITEAQTWKHVWEETPFLIIGSIQGDHFLTDGTHSKTWKTFVSEHAKDHAYTAAAKVLTDLLVQ